MVQTVVIEGIYQGFEYMTLASHFPEVPGTPFSCQYLISHLKWFAITLQLPNSAASPIIVCLGYRLTEIPR